LSEATISAAVSNGPAVRPFFTPSSANFSRASITRSCAGVYSSSADGSFGTILMTPPETLNSTRSPVLIPALRRTLRGTTNSFLDVTTTVILLRVPVQRGIKTGALGFGSA
jgi:hypothetical protein